MGTISALDRVRLAQALEHAHRSVGISDPNPRVGCIVANADGVVVGEGHTQAAGQAHAEVMALNDCRNRGLTCRGGTAWVTLEPCAHHGRTPPCTTALIAAGLARVVVALRDPYGQVDGRGIQQLQSTGIAVDTLEPADDLALSARDLNIGFLSRVERGRPWVRLKIAASLDGMTALANGQSQWITSSAARADGRAFRRRAGAIVTGVGTVLADDPRLDVRDGLPLASQPLRFVFDRLLSTPPTAKILQAPGRAILVGQTDVDPRRVALLREAGTEIWSLGDANDSQAMPHQFLERVATLDINELHIEAGARLNATWLNSGLVDEVLIYMAPCLLGQGGRPMADLGPWHDMNQALRLHLMSIDRVGPDIRLRLTSAARFA